MQPWVQAEGRAGLAICACVLSSALIAGSTQQQPLAHCEPAAQSVYRVDPPNLGRAQLYIIGNVSLELRLARSGAVDAVQVVSSTIEVLGRSSEALAAGRFEQDLTASVRQWRFAPLAHGCMQRVAMKFESDD
jgi:hypothetical protein